MKRKDIIQLGAIAVIFMIAGLVASSQFIPKGKVKPEAVVEVIGPITPNFDSAALAWIKDDTKARDFTVTIDLNGLGNPTPFSSR